MQIEPPVGLFPAMSARGAVPFGRPRAGRRVVRFPGGREQRRGRPGYGLPAAAPAP